MIAYLKKPEQDYPIYFSDKECTLVKFDTEGSIYTSYKHLKNEILKLNACLSISHRFIDRYYTRYQELVLYYAKGVIFSRKLHILILFTTDNVYIDEAWFSLNRLLPSLKRQLKELGYKYKNVIKLSSIELFNKYQDYLELKLEDNMPDKLKSVTDDFIKSMKEQYTEVRVNYEEESEF